MIKCIIFDYNGVFNDTHNKEFSELLSKEYRIPIARTKSLLSIWGDEHDLGIISSKKYWENFNKNIGFKNKVNFEQLYYSSSPADKKMFELVKKLRKKHKVVLLTNMGRGLYNHELKKYKLENKFDRIFVSSKLNMIKPHVKIYKHVLSSLHLKPDKCVFVDDRIKNIIGAKRLGMRTILFKCIEQFKRELRKIFPKSL